MSRVYFTASLPHEKFGKGLPTLSFETNDHTGGGYHIAGVHATSLAALLGRGPEVQKGERFDLKFNLNAKRTSLSLVVMTTKHLPHWEWSSSGGAGKLPLAALGTLATQFFRTGHLQMPIVDDKRKKGSKDRKGDKSILAPKSAIYTSDGRVRQKPLDDKRRGSERSSGRASRGPSSSPPSPPSPSSSSHNRHTHTHTHTHTHAHAQTSTRDGTPRRPRRSESLSSTSRHSSKRSRKSSSHSEHSHRHSVSGRAGPRKQDRDYDSGYASADPSLDEDKPRNSSRRKSPPKGRS